MITRRREWKSAPTPSNHAWATRLWRGTQRYEVIYRTDEDALMKAIVALA